MTKAAMASEGAFQPALGRFQVLAPGVRCPDPSDVPAHAMRNLHAALTAFYAEVNATS